MKGLTNHITCAYDGHMETTKKGNQPMNTDTQQQWQEWRKDTIAQINLQHAEESEWMTAPDYHNAKCDYCNSKAIYDAQTINGFWSFVCDQHFAQHTHQRLGLGFGQRLIPIDTPK